MMDHLMNRLVIPGVELMLALCGIPDPKQYAYETVMFDFCDTIVYPLSKTRRHWVLGCLRTRWSPWKSDHDIQTILQENDGRLPQEIREILGELTTRAFPEESRVVC